MDDKAAQRRDALAKANDVRDARARLKRAIKTNAVSLPRVVRAPPDYAHNMKIGELLTAARGFGAVRATKLLSRCDIAYSRRTGALSQRQRDVLAAAIDREYERAYQHAKAAMERPNTPLAANASAIVHVQLRS